MFSSCSCQKQPPKPTFHNATITIYKIYIYIIVLNFQTYPQNIYNFTGTGTTPEDKDTNLWICIGDVCVMSGYKKKSQLLPSLNT